MDTRQQLTDALQKGLKMIVRSRAGTGQVKYALDIHP